MLTQLVIIELRSSFRDLESLSLSNDDDIVVSRLGSKPNLDLELGD